MQELLVVIRVMEVSLHSLLGLDFRLFGLFSRAMAHVVSCL